MKTKNLAIMLTDIKGFTDTTSRNTREQIISLLKKHNEVVIPILNKYYGTIVKTIGDAFLVTFESPTNAVLCGIMIQEKLLEFNKNQEEARKINIRIAINAGEVYIDESGDIFGDAVNITSRIESIAEADEVFFTESVYLSMNKNEVPSSEIGYRQFKGIADKIKVYKVLREDPVDLNEPPISEPEQPKQDEAPTPSSESKNEEKAEESFEKAKNSPNFQFGKIGGMITGMLSKMGLPGNIDIDEDGRKVKINNGKIHVIKDGKEIHIDKNGITIKKIKKNRSKE